MKKLVLFIDSLASGGAQRQIATLARELSKLNYDVTLLVYYDFDDYESYVKGYNVKIDKVLKTSKYDLSFYSRIYSYFKKNREAVYISYLNTPTTILRVLGGLAGVNKIITSERNIDLVHSKFRVFLERLFFRLSEHIVVNAYAIKSMMVEIGVPEDKVVCIYNGVDTDYFSARENQERILFRESLGFLKDDKVILLPGRIMKQKNHMCLLKAFSKLVKKHSGLKILFVGNEFDLEIKKQLIAYSKSQGFENEIVYAGFQGDMPLVYTSVDLVVLPSLWEGLPNGVIEGMSCSKLVIASDVSDNSMIIENGVNGFITKVDDVNDLVEKMDIALSLDDPDKLLLEVAARSTIVDLCGLKKFAQQYEELIRS